MSALISSETEEQALPAQGVDEDDVLWTSPATTDACAPGKWHITHESLLEL